MQTTTMTKRPTDTRAHFFTPVYLPISTVCPRRLSPIYTRCLHVNERTQAAGSGILQLQVSQTAEARYVPDDVMQFVQPSVQSASVNKYTQPHVYVSMLGVGTGQRNRCIQHGLLMKPTNWRTLVQYFAHWPVDLL